MIIRNCPSTYQNFEEKFVCTSQIKEKGFPFYCQDCTDCVLKKIYENLKQVAISGQCDNCDGIGYYNGCDDTECGMYQALKSIELLEIEDNNE